VITPRTTRLVRAADLRSFRSILTALATDGSPLDVRDRLIVIPTRAAAHHLLRSIEDRLHEPAATVLPDMVTRAELHDRLFQRVPQHLPSLTLQEREALLTVACSATVDAGVKPPFRIRPGLVGAMLEFFDSLKRHQKSVDDFERLALGRLDGGAEHDRGAERLVRQTRFLAAAYREFERRCQEAGGVDEHIIRGRLLATEADQPWRHVIVAVRDRAADRYGLYPVDWDLLARLAGLRRIDVVVTEATLVGTFHERIHQWLPGIDEVRAEPASSGLPLLDLCGVPTAACVVARDREDEISGFARWIRHDVAVNGGLLDRTALVVRQRLPYVYLAREVFRVTGIPHQMFDALPLAAEPFAAVVDVLFSCVSANFARSPSVSLLRSPHLQFITDEGRTLRLAEVAALDRALSEAGYLGGVDVLVRFQVTWRAEGGRVSQDAVNGLSALETIVRELEPLRANATVANHLDRILRFLSEHAAAPGVGAMGDVPVARQLRARAAILGVMRALRDGYRRFSSDAVPFDQVAAMVRRHIEVHTFAPRTGESGVHVVDADSAPFGEFDYVHIAGLVDGEWPEQPHRNIFYSSAILRDLSWPADADRVESARSAFSDLLQLPQKELVVSTFSLEHDSLVTPSVLLDQIAEPHEQRSPGSRIPDPGSRIPDPGPRIDPGIVLSETARSWATWRLERSADSTPTGRTDGHVASGYAVSALERYQDCPFQFFASHVLQLDEAPEDEPALSPRARGRFIHEVFQRFFEQWDGRGERTITSEHIDSARALFAQVAEPLLATLPEADATLERTRLFGSAISVGIVDVVLGLEASRPVDVIDRWLEFRLDGRFSLGNGDGRTVPLRGVADRIDLLSGRRLRVIDYKTGYPPQAKRALQVPIYALCAQERLAERGEGKWAVDEAAYVAFSGKRPFVSVMSTRSGQDAVLADARARLLEVVDGIERGEFPVQPYDTRICSYCAYPSVCRKDYVGDE
jgi:RecB family exonuclease